MARKDCEPCGGSGTVDVITRTSQANVTSGAPFTGYIDRSVEKSSHQCTKCSGRGWYDDGGSGGQDGGSGRLDGGRLNSL
jgi:hypothetical protein